MSHGGGVWLDGADLVGGTVTANELSALGYVTAYTSGPYLAISVNGGGIACQGDCSVTGTEVSANIGDFGAGIGVQQGTLALNAVLVHDNGDADTWGGGLACWASRCTLDAATVISGNRANQGGGAIVAFGDLTGGAIDGNGATVQGGGVMLLEGAVSGLSVTGNDAPLGGGIAAFAGVALADATVLDNTANQGGGVWVEGAATVEGGEILRNTALTEGGGVWIGVEASVRFAGTDLGQGADDNTPGDVFAGGLESSYDGPVDLFCDTSGCEL